MNTKLAFAFAPRGNEADLIYAYREVLPVEIIEALVGGRGAMEQLLKQWTSDKARNEAAHRWGVSMDDVEAYDERVEWWDASLQKEALGLDPKEFLVADCQTRVRRVT